MQMQIYFSSITQGVIAHSPEPEAHDQSVRRQIELEFRSGFLEGGKPEYPEKNPQSTGENQQTLLTYHAGSGNRTRAIVVRGERSHRCATRAPHS